MIAFLLLSLLVAIFVLMGYIKVRYYNAGQDMGASWQVWRIFK